ncbi:788_t:CDS:1, partial [Funneliformis mosseae]
QDYDDDNKRLYSGSRETEYDASQILFSFLIENVSVKQIIQV